MTASESHLTTTAERVTDEAAAGKPDESHLMNLDDVAVASLVGLDRGEVVCVPGLDDPSYVDDLAAAEAKLRGAARATQRSARYDA